MLMQEGLLNAPSGAELAWQHQVLYDNVIALAVPIAAVSYSCRILENQFEEAVCFLGSYERPPATQLHEKLGRPIRAPDYLGEGSCPSIRGGAALTFCAKHPTSKPTARSDNRRQAILRPTYQSADQWCHRAAGTMASWS